MVFRLPSKRGNMNDQSLSTIVTSTSLDILILGWLDAKFRRSESTRTQKEYGVIIEQFRNTLQQRGIDLDSYEGIMKRLIQGDIHQEDRQAIQEQADKMLALISLVAQDFAGFSARGKQVSRSTYNLRLSVISSFYEYCIKKRMVTVNPIKSVERGKVEQYAKARALDNEDVDKALKAIDRNKLQGKRDYALLSLLLQTGRRLNEVVSLELQHLFFQGGKLVVSFEHCKGGKVMRDILPLPVADALLEWLHVYYGEIKIGAQGDTRPLWVCLIRSGRAERQVGDRLGRHGIANICQRYLGVSTVHTTRHTWAKNMQEVGAPVNVIQKRLGHASLATTGRYMEALSKDENPYAEQLAAHYGIK